MTIQTFNEFTNKFLVVTVMTLISGKKSMTALFEGWRKG